MKLVYGSCSKPGTDYYGHPKEAQDAIITECSLGGEKNLLVGVLDGHGPEGGIVSNVVADLLPRAIADNTLYQAGSYQALMDTVYPDLNVLLNRGGAIDTRASGCTVCTALFPGGDQLVVTNLGAARCLLGRLSPATKSGVETVCLTRDHTADQSQEAERIRSHKGFISQYRHQGTPVGPRRVWTVDQVTPGLRVTRSLGDTEAHTIGVTCIPDVQILTLQPEDRYLVLATDGLLSFMSDQELIDILHVAATVHDMCPRQAAKHLVREARKRWAVHEQGLVDDCSCVVVYLTHEAPMADGHVSVRAKAAPKKLLNPATWLSGLKRAPSLGAMAKAAVAAEAS